MVRFVVDTGVFFRPDAVMRLEASKQTVVVPAAVFMERARHLRRRGVDPAEWLATLDKAGFIVEPFATVQALRYAVTIEDDGLWKRLYRDAMIAGHVGPDDILLTTNPRDFIRIGMDPGQVFGV